MGYDQQVKSNNIGRELNPDAWDNIRTGLLNTVQYPTYSHRMIEPLQKSQLIPLAGIARSLLPPSLHYLEIRAFLFSTTARPRENLLTSA